MTRRILSLALVVILACSALLCLPASGEENTDGSLVAKVTTKKGIPATPALAGRFLNTELVGMGIEKFEDNLINLDYLPNNENPCYGIISRTIFQPQCSKAGYNN